MQIIKPAWLSHSGEQKDFEVYSCHVSPDGERLATAGGDGHVRIWSTEAIYDADNKSKPRQLCHMSHHLGTIHSVRFSPNNRYLASGADDKIICIYVLDSNPPSQAAMFGSNEPPPVENWKTHRRLVGHENDVQDLAWSHDNSILVSVGLDSKVVVWSGHTFEKLKVLAMHQSHVKGITFDPANKYFATASDDRTIKIFRFTPPAPNATQHDMVNNFVLETTISSPFKSSPLTTYFRRCSWSPDGNHIAAANAVNGPVSSVAIIERSRWDSEINLIGHEGPTEVCMFSPRLFHTQQPTENGAPASSSGLVTVIASAGQDKTLTIWNTNTSRPLVIVQDAASKSISDLSWTPDGQTLFAASLDGSIVTVRFETGELGWVATSEENDKALQKYGGARKGMGTAEDVDALRLEGLSKEVEMKGAESRMGKLMGDPRPATNGTTTTNGTKSATKNGNTKETSGTPDTKSGKETPGKDTPSEESADKAAERILELKSRVQITKDGKKRVAPLLVSSSGTGLLSLPQSQLVGASSVAKPVPSDVLQTILDLSKPQDRLPSGGLGTLLLGNKRKAAAAEKDDDDEQASKRAALGPVPLMVNGTEALEPASLTAPAHGVAPPPEFIRSPVMHPILTYAQIRLAIPKVRSHIIRPWERGVLQGETTLDEATKLPENIVLEARNPVNTREPSRIMATKRGALLWQDFLPRAVLLVTGTKYFWAAACEDGSVHTWSPAGKRLMNAMMLDSQPSFLEARDHWLLMISSVGMCHVLNVKTMTAAFPPVSMGPVLELAMTALSLQGPTPGPGITSAHLNSIGAIIITLSNGDGVLYSPKTLVWQKLSEGWWAAGSQYWNSNDSSIGGLSSTAVGPLTGETAAGNALSTPKPGSTAKTNVSAGIIPFLERHTTTEFLFKGRAWNLQRLVKSLMSKDGFEGIESTVSVAHLENRMAGALALGSQEEFRLYLFMYAKRIGAEGLKDKAEELLKSLVGGVLGHNAEEEREQGANGWFGSGPLCGWERNELLKGVVLILGKFRELHRLTSQYARILQLTSGEEDEDEDGGVTEGNGSVSGKGSGKSKEKGGNIMDVDE